MKEEKGTISKLIWFFLDNPLITFLALFGVILGGIFVLPFDMPQIDRHIDRAPVPVDAIPDIGENQQIVFTQWMGRSPQDVEDQITYPLAVALQGIPGVKSIRSYSLFGFSSIYIIFEEKIEFYWSRSRVLERLAVASKDLPEGVTPVLGPDATALGQIYWYTLEGKGFSLEELRSLQDWYVRYALQTASGVSEVASVGGFVREYQIDVDPAAMWEYKVSLHEIFMAVKKANIDVGARTIEHNGVEYVIRGIGFIKNIKDVEQVVVKEVNNTPIYLKQIAHASLGPALRRGALDKEGAEAVGGVVVVRYGENPLKVIKAVKKQIAKIEPGLPQKKLKDGTISRVSIVPFYDRTELIHETLDTLKDALIDETLITILVILVFLMHFRSSMVVSLSLPLGVLVAFIFMRIYGVDSNIMSLSGIAIAIGAMVDMGIIMTENIVNHWEEAPPDANRLKVVYTAAAEVGGAILTAISTTIISFLPIFFMEGPEGKLFKPLAFTKTFALFGSVLVALIFNPVFCYLLFGEKKQKTMKWMVYLQWVGKLLLVGLGFSLHFWLGTLLVFYYGYRLLEKQMPGRIREKSGPALCYFAILFVLYFLSLRVMPLGKNMAFWKNFLAMGGLMAVLMYSLFLFIRYYDQTLIFLLNHKKSFMTLPLLIIITGVTIWLGFDNLFGGTLSTLGLNEVYITRVQIDEAKELNRGKIGETLKEAFHKQKIPLADGAAAKVIEKDNFWEIVDQGKQYTDQKRKYLVRKVGDHLNIYDQVRQYNFWKRINKIFPGLGKEFMPDLDEGSYLYMPTTMPHASLGEAMDMLKKQDIALKQIPEVEMVVGKLGRVQSPLDPAPVSMIETIITYKKEYIYGRGYLFEGEKKWKGELDRKKIPSPLIKSLKKRNVTIYKPSLEVVTGGEKWVIQNNGTAYTAQMEEGKLKVYEEEKWVRQWRPQIKDKESIWQEITKATEITGSTMAPRLQPIAARIVMLQTGMRAPMGIKVKGKDLKEIEKVGFQLEKYLKEVPSVEPAAVNADRIIGKPYLEFVLDREKMARYGVNIRDVQDIIEVAIGGKGITTTVEGRERYPVRVRYKRELRDTPEAMKRILVPTRRGTQIPLSQVSTLRFIRGPQVIKSEDTFLVGYVLFDKKPGYAEVDVVEACQKLLQEKMKTGEFELPRGTSYEFSGSYENQVRAAKRMMILLPTSILIIFLLIYLQFRSVALTLIVFIALPVALSGGFLLLWFYGQPWFMNFSVFGIPIREMFHMQQYNLSIAVWVGFIALFGVATDDGVVIGTYLVQSFETKKPKTVEGIREATLAAGRRRIRPCLMTVATTVLALVPVLMSTGKGSDVMIPMALPTVGGLSIVLITLFVVPVCYCGLQEMLLKAGLLKYEDAGEKE